MLELRRVPDNIIKIISFSKPLVLFWDKENCHWWVKCLGEDGCLFRKKSVDIFLPMYWIYQYISLDIYRTYHYILGNVSIDRYIDIHLFWSAIPRWVYWKRYHAYYKVLYLQKHGIEPVGNGAVVEVAALGLMGCRFDT